MNCLFKLPVLVAIYRFFLAHKFERTRVTLQKDVWHKNIKKTTQRRDSILGLKQRVESTKLSFVKEPKLFEINLVGTYIRVTSFLYLAPEHVFIIKHHELSESSFV